MLTDDLPRLTALVDGGTRSNPGTGACAAWFPQLKKVVGAYLPYTTNNQAEYKGLLLALREAKAMGYGALDVYTDSKLMQMQVLGKWQVKNDGLKPLYIEARSLIRKLDDFSITHIPREQNKEADAECNRIQDLMNDS